MDSDAINKLKYPITPWGVTPRSPAYDYNTVVLRFHKLFHFEVDLVLRVTLLKGQLVTLKKMLQIGKNIMSSY